MKRVQFLWIETPPWGGVVVGNPVVFPWGLQRRGDGRHSTCTNELVWRESIIVARGEIMPMVSMS